MQAAPYLTFNGNCREAMTFYQGCLGGELFFQTVGDSPGARSDGHRELPAKMRGAILHASLQRKDMCLYASDMVSEDGLIKGNSVSLILMCNSKKEIARIYDALSKDGTEASPPNLTYWKSYFGTLTDKFGVHWLLSASVK
jgi:PhnB protein